MTSTELPAADFANLSPEELAQHLLEVNQVQFAPVNIAAVARAAGVHLFTANFKGAKQAQIDFNSEENGRIEVTVARNLSRPWKRILVAKELYLALRAIREPTDNDRTAAERFGLALLTPEQMVRAHWPILKDVAAMAAAFDVPVDLMQGRLHALDLGTRSDDDHPEDHRIGRKPLTRPAQRARRDLLSTHKSG